MRMRLSAISLFFLFLAGLPARIAGMDLDAILDATDSEYQRDQNQAQGPDKPTEQFFDALDDEVMVPDGINTNLISGKIPQLRNNMVDYLEQLDTDPALLIRSSEEALRAQSQNTVLLGHKNFPFALYKRDALELPFLIADLTLGYLFFKYFKQKRTTHLYKVITEHVDTTLKALNDMKIHNQTLKDKQNTPEATEATTALTAIWQELSNQHAYIGYNLFKLEALLPLSFFTLAYKASAYAQQKCIVKRSWAPEAQFAWTKKADGSYEQFKLEGKFNPSSSDLKKEFYNVGNINEHNPNNDPVHEFKEVMGLYARIGKFSINLTKKALFWSDAPLSLVTALKMFIGSNPNASPIEQAIPIDKALGKTSPNHFWSKLFYTYMGLPMWLHRLRNNPTTDRLIEICSFLVIPVLINGICHAVWLEYLKNNSDELITILEGYKATRHLSNNDQDRKQVQQDLKEFIEVGNTFLGNNLRYGAQEFFAFKWLGSLTVHGKVNAWMSIICLTILLSKSKSFFQYAYALFDTGMLGDLPEAAKVIIFTLVAECIWIGGTIIAIQASTVYGDLKLAKEWVIEKVKKIFSSTKSDNCTNAAAAV